MLTTLGTRNAGTVVPRSTLARFPWYPGTPATRSGSAGDVPGRQLSVDQVGGGQVQRAGVAAQDVDAVPAVVGGHQLGPLAELPAQQLGVDRRSDRVAPVLEHQHIGRPG